MDLTPLIPKDVPLSPPSRPAAERDEALVADARAGLTPAEMVERKLFSLLRSTPIPVSQIGQRRPARATC